jgi:(R,R)-butanediol dehydrogenase/meso-butanediol dehydrogenase/diacetyl reductase
MLALRWHGRADVRVDEIEPPPPPGPGQVQLRVAWCGICDTDVEEYRNGPVFIPVASPNPLTGRKAPLTLGHEFAGEVVAVGAGVTGLRRGDRVAADTLIFCGECYWCRRHQVTLCERLAALGLMADGGLAELCNAPAHTLLPIPDGVSDEAGALAETLAVAVRALRRGRLEIGERVAVIGAGAVGLMAVQAAVAGGASAVTAVEPLAGRRRLAGELGAASTLTPTEAPTGEADLVVECSGSPRAIETALRMARKGGRVVLVGIYGGPTEIQFLDVVGAEKELLGSLSHVYDEDFAAALALLGRGAVRAEPLVSDRIPLARALEDGLLALLREPEAHLKILIKPCAAGNEAGGGKTCAPAT